MSDPMVVALQCQEFGSEWCASVALFPLNKRQRQREREIYRKFDNGITHNSIVFTSIIIYSDGIALCKRVYDIMKSILKLCVVNYFITGFYYSISVVLVHYTSFGLSC